MGETTGISWADHTFNPVIGCTKVGPGCDNCYAERDMAVRRKVVEWGPGAQRKVTSDHNWLEPVKWNKKAIAAGERRRVFCASLADVFDNEWDPAIRERLFDLIEATPQLDWMLLTKRIGNVRDMTKRWARGWPPHVWLGITVVNQVEANRDIPKQLELRGLVRVLWLSIEPILGPINLQAIGAAKVAGGLWGWNVLSAGGARVDWVIVGGESGPKARPAGLAWVRDLRNQCVSNRVAFHFKQWGEYRPLGQRLASTDIGLTGTMGPDDAKIYRIENEDFERPGKKAAGHMLDGREHLEFPA